MKVFFVKVREVLPYEYSRQAMRSNANLMYNRTYVSTISQSFKGGRGVPPIQVWPLAKCAGLNALCVRCALDRGWTLRGRKYLLTNGHHRLAAAMRAGLKEVPAVLRRSAFPSVRQKTSWRRVA